MTVRENIMAILNYENHDHMPVVSFGYWQETLNKWAEEGHISLEEAREYETKGYNSEADKSIMKKLGIDFCWGNLFGSGNQLYPKFAREVRETRSDGSQVIRNEEGLLVLEKPGVVSIPAEIGTSLTGREAWEELYLPRFQWNPERIDFEQLKKIPKLSEREYPIGLYCGSLIGYMRNILGIEELSYLYLDDEELYQEIVDTIAGVGLKCTEEILKTGVVFDYGHFWEDICYNHGPLVNPDTFRTFVAPHYKKYTELLKRYDINIVSLDCDGCIDLLLPIWLENGVNTMFPIEVGTWGASIGPWREKYGKTLRGVGGMDKRIFAKDYKAIDEEVERLKPLIAMGGYIPCPDHLIPPDAKFEMVQYYCDRIHEMKI